MKVLAIILTVFLALSIVAEISYQTKLCGVPLNKVFPLNSCPCESISKLNMEMQDIRERALFFNKQEVYEYPR